MISLIKMLRHEYGVRQLYFYDDTFTANPKNVKDFCRAMIEAKLDVSWICYVRGDMFSDDVAKLMSEAGCHQVLLGIESGSSTLMEKIGKPIDVKKYKDTVERAHRFNIEVRGSFIIGHVDETMETMKETTDFAKYLDLDFFQLNIMTPYPGTQLFKNLKLEGQLLHEDYNLYGQNELVFKLKNLMPQQVYQYEKAAFKAFYFRPGMVLKQLGRLKNIRMLGDLFKALALLIFEFKVGKDKALEEWLRFDVRGHSLEGIVPPEQPQLTYQLRQGFEG